MKVIFVAIAAFLAGMWWSLPSAPAAHPPTTKVDYCLSPYNKLMFLPCSEVDRYEKA